MDEPLIVIYEGPDRELWLVTSLVLPSEYVAVTFAVVLPPAYISFLVKDIEIDDSVTLFFTETLCDAVILFEASFADNETVVIMDPFRILKNKIYYTES